jgi:hypothetical protein
MEVAWGRMQGRKRLGAGGSGLAVMDFGAFLTRGHAWHFEDCSVRYLIGWEQTVGGRGVGSLHNRLKRYMGGMAAGLAVERYRSRVTGSTN